MVPAPLSSRVLVVAAAGYGASSLLERRRPDGAVVVPAASVARDGLPAGSWVGIDRLDGLDPAARRAVLQHVAHAGDRAVEVTSRLPLTSDERALLPGIVHERGPADLALAPFDVATCLAQEYGVHDPELASEVARLTAGWPMLVHLAGDQLVRDRPVTSPATRPLVERLAAPGSPVAAWLTAEVLTGLPEPVRWAVAAVAGLGPVTQPLCDAAARAAGRDPASLAGAVELAARTGLLVPQPATGRLALVPLLEHVLTSGERGRMPQGPDRVRLLRAAGEVQASTGDWLPAARALATAGEVAAAVALVEDHGEDMVRSGGAAAVVELVDDLTTCGTALGRSAEHTAYAIVVDELPHRVRLVHADALRRSGDLARARRAFGVLAEEAERDGWTAGLVVRMAQLHYTKGEFGAALTVLKHPVREPGRDEDVVDLLACRVHVLAVLGHVDDAITAATAAMRVADASGEPRLLATAHLAAARVTRGARKEAHHEEALRAAVQGGDTATTARVLAAQAHLLLAGARYTEACPVGRRSAELAELVSPPGLRAAALHNLGEALARVGEVEEARWQLSRSIAVCRRLGPARAALGLVGLGDLHRELGHVEQSRAAYGEAVELARGSGDSQVLVGALAGLARLTAGLAPDDGGADGSDDGGASGAVETGGGEVAGRWPTAVAAVEEAERLAPTALLPIALMARGWVELAGGRPTEAAVTARRALDSARRVGAADLLAESLELLAATETEPEAARTALVEALSVWQGGGAAPAAARVAVQLGRLSCADSTERSRAREAGRTLLRLGVTHVHRRPVLTTERACEVTIQVLGGFLVHTCGDEVALTQWRSRQARTLVKVLVAARGRVVTRGLLCELLWPDDDPSRTGHRLSVLLATVRGVLDPGRSWPTDHFVAADQQGVWLDLRRVTVDAEMLLLDAAHAAALMDAGDDAQAMEILSHVDARYGGDAFEEEGSEEWALPLREQTRGAWLRSVRRLATLHARAGHAPEALGLLTRLLCVDPYDELVHRRLVVSLSRAGRHGEARRAWDRWAAAMRELDAPGPDPSLLVAERPVLTSR